MPMVRHRCGVGQRISAASPELGPGANFRSKHPSLISVQSSDGRQPSRKSSCAGQPGKSKITITFMLREGCWRWKLQTVQWGSISGPSLALLHSVSGETVPGLVLFINPPWVMWVLQSAPCAKCGFGRYSRASLNPFRLGKESILDHLPPRLFWPVLSHESAHCPQRLLAGLYHRQQCCEEGRRKLETKWPCTGHLKK